MDDRLSESTVFGQSTAPLVEGGPAVSPASVAAEAGPAPSKPEVSPNEPDPFEALRTGDRAKVAGALTALLRAIWGTHSIANAYCVLSIFDSKTSISAYELDRIYAGLKERNANKEKDVLLLLMSTGGEIEPAYQISKICKTFAKSKFVVCIPRFAKSAATLISLGADEVHLGVLGHLGPIDPQVGGLPALAVARALETLAELVERYPDSANMFAQYLEEKLPVQQIGYFERVAESAVQYGGRLLQTKEADLLANDPFKLAHTLVHDYKDHGFVIDFDEATAKLGDSWIRNGTAEVLFAEAFYSAFAMAESLVRMGAKKHLALIGSLDPGDLPLSIYLGKL
jgi:hypothetical protein